MSLFTSGPPEIICRILSVYDSISHLLALATTCKHLHLVWLENNTSIIRHVARLSIPSFEDALLAIRATEIVQRAQESCQQPPNPFPINELSSIAKHPGMKDLEGVIKLQRFARLIEFAFLNDKSVEGGPVDLPENEEEWLAWRETFHRSFYRLFFVGAVLSGSYMEPFSLAIKEKRTETLTLGKKYGSDLTEEGMEYLRRFAVYNFDADDESEVGIWRDKQYESIFGPLARWFVELSPVDNVQSEQALYEAQRDNSDWGSDSDQFSLDSALESADKSSLREILFLLAANEHFSRMSRRYNWAPRYEREEARTLSRDEMNQREKITIVPFSDFRALDIYIPASSTWAREFPPQAKHDITSSQLQEKTDERSNEDVPFSVKSVDVRRYITQLNYMSTRPNRFDGEEPPPPFLQFFVFVLRRYFNLRFCSGTFDDHEDDSYARDVICGSVFASYPMFPFTTYKPPVLSYVGSEFE
ncbi:hypothetical protein VTL71DRAFT_9501 [Oculimacula yallundae]|uniref:F-box domain-containing protein n=1 Tax=Oculimacula yallundae TaxID=86028 RepID=A0ABR4BS34_9HELO